MTSIAQRRARIVMQACLVCSVITFVLCTCAVLTAGAQAPADHTIIQFDVPGAGTGGGQGTTPVGIVDDGSVFGYYIDSSNLIHGFVRSPSGNITTFDGPGSVFTIPTGMNSTHSIVGYYELPKSQGVPNGFTRSPSGEIKTLNAPGAVLGTTLAGVNDKGEIAGFYYDANFASVGFVVSPAGKFTKFKAPGVGNNSGQGTVVAFDGLTGAGAIAVNGVDSNDVSHGYLRTPGGEFTEFDPTGSVNTYAYGINGKDTIVGRYFDSSGAVHGFVREAGGAITLVNAPNATFGTNLSSINASGASAGTYFDSDGFGHGFVLSPGGDITEFSVPGAGAGTFPARNNAAGSITGYWIDSNLVIHGFVRKDCPQFHSERGRMHQTNCR
jgi:hypothetical protein